MYLNNDCYLNVEVNYLTTCFLKDSLFNIRETKPTILSRMKVVYFQTALVRFDHGEETECSCNFKHVDHKWICLGKVLDFSLFRESRSSN